MTRKETTLTVLSAPTQQEGLSPDQACKRRRHTLAQMNIHIHRRRRSHPRKQTRVKQSQCRLHPALHLLLYIRQATRAHKTTQWPKLVYLSKCIRDSTACSSSSTRTIYKACGLLSKTPTSTPRGIGKRARAALLCARPPIMRFDSRD